jgi:hypothetical protein
MRRPHRRSQVSLKVEALETRLTPSWSPWLVEGFDATAGGALPSGWSQWSSQAGGQFATATNAALSPTKSLASTVASSSTTARAFVTAAAAADVKVSAAVNLNSLVPMEVLLRGSGLNTTSPS